MYSLNGIKYKYKRDFDRAYNRLKKLDYKKGANTDYNPKDFKVVRCEASACIYKYTCFYKGEYKREIKVKKKFDLYTKCLIDLSNVYKDNMFTFITDDMNNEYINSLKNDIILKNYLSAKDVDSELYEMYFNNFCLVKIEELQRG